jgi:pilus assembly protein TadC
VSNTGLISAKGGRRSRFGLRPDTVALTADLLAMAVAAGLTPHLAVELTVRFAPGPVAERLGAVLAAAEGGLRLADALDAEAARCPELASTLALLAASERSGAPVGAALIRLAAATRAQARRRAMARARTVPIRLLFPLVFLVLPAFLVLTVAPVVLASLTY